jgi:hypothetical protein
MTGFWIVKPAGITPLRGAGQINDGDLRLGPNVRRGLEFIHPPGSADVHQHQIWTQVNGLLDGLTAGPGDGEDRIAELGEEPREVEGNDASIFHEGAAWA